MTDHEIEAVIDAEIAEQRAAAEREQAATQAFNERCWQDPWVGPLLWQDIRQRNRNCQVARQQARKTPEQLARDRDRECRRNEIRGRIAANRATIDELQGLICSNLYSGRRLASLRQQLDTCLRNAGAFQSQLLAIL
jgi:hypothetical protein